jgi:hypothetical protein
MGRVSAQNHVVHKRKTLLDFEIFSDFRDFFGFKSQKIRFSPLVSVTSSCKKLFRLKVQVDQLRVTR